MYKITLVVVRLILIFNIYNLNALHAEELNMPDQTLIKHIEKSISKELYNSIIIASIDEDAVTLQSFGELTKGTGILPNVDTLFELSSVSKSFLGSLVAIMVDRNEIKLSDPINKYLPDGVVLQSFKGKDITILDLLTHHSGLPTVPEDYAVIDNINPYKDYTRQDLWNSINVYKPARKAGIEWQYSNFSFAILSEALAYKKGKSYFEVLKDYIFIPLKMNDTYQILNDDQKNKLAQGHTEDGTKIDSLMDQVAMRAAGFMITSTNDMIKFIRAHMGGHPLSDALKRSHKIYTTGTEVALAWEHNTGSLNRYNYGTAHGYRSFAGFNEDGSKGTVVFTNRKYGAIDIGKRILDNKYKLPAVK